MASLQHLLQVSVNTLIHLDLSIAKVGFNFGDDGIIPLQILPIIGLSNDGGDSILRYILNAAFIVLMLLSNGLMMKYFVMSMHENGAAKATVYNFVINYIASVRGTFDVVDKV